MRIYSIFLTIGAALLTVACAPAPSPAGDPGRTGGSAGTGSAEAGSLAGTAWTLVDLGGRSLEPPPARGAPTLRFDATDRLGGFAGCNTFFASYQLQGAQLRFGEIGSTRMACTDDDSMTLEQQYLAALGTVTRWERSGSTLTLSSDQRTVARFRLGAADPRS